jgi:ATP-dependent 26S proteasome regulatory subunit
VIHSTDDQRRRLLDTEPGTPLGAALERAECLLEQPLPQNWDTLPVDGVRFQWAALSLYPADAHLFLPSGERAPARTEPSTPAEPDEEPLPERPDELTDEIATRVCYGPEMREIASLLRSGLSVLVASDKIVVPHLAERTVLLADLEARIVQAPLEDPAETQAQASPDALRDLPPLPQETGNSRQRQLNLLRDEIRTRKNGQVIVIPHLDLLAGGADSSVGTETREVTDLMYGAPDAVFLAFTDPSLTIPEVLAARFSRRLALEGSPRVVVPPGGPRPVPLSRAVITRGEADLFQGLSDTDFYKHVAGLNPVRVRQAMRYAIQVNQGRDRVSGDDLYETIRSFKAHLTTGFEIPKVTFEEIGGYEDVKAELREALKVMQEAPFLPESQRHLRAELVPRGFIFHGPPGTGKTLLAKAVAAEMSGTIQVVSGPEVTSKWVGEGERKVRELFAEARRNAPSVVVFDEFDSIAAKRSSWDDGGSRAANAMVAQILTEMDGFRPDVAMLVIGTTNRLDIIDPALLRPSRFRSFHIDLPNTVARRKIVEVHAERYGFDVGELAEEIAKRTPEWNGDELRSLFHAAYIAKWVRHRPLDTLEQLADQLGELIGTTERARQDRQMSRRRRN